jgi:hypothetical protein
MDFPPRIVSTTFLNMPLELTRFWPNEQWKKSVTNSVSDPDPHSICLLDPDPAADEINSKSQKKSYNLELFDYLKKLLSYLFKL